MTIIYNKTDKKETRRILRKDSTQPEQLLWKYIRASQLGVKFRRQYSVGRYILDFYAPSIKLCIELDGDSHFTDEGKEYDIIRTEYLYNLGIHVLRFTNIDVMNNMEGVLDEIQRYLS